VAEWVETPKLKMIKLKMLLALTFVLLLSGIAEESTNNALYDQESALFDLLLQQDSPSEDPVVDAPLSESPQPSTRRAHPGSLAGLTSLAELTTTSDSRRRRTATVYDDTHLRRRRSTDSRRRSSDSRRRSSDSRRRSSATRRRRNSSDSRRRRGYYSAVGPIASTCSVSAAIAIVFAVLATRV